MPQISSAFRDMELMDRFLRGIMRPGIFPGGDEREAFIAMTDVETPLTNLDRLLAHLKGDSLAAALVLAYREAGEGDKAESMKVLIAARLEQVRADLDVDEA